MTVLPQNNCSVFGDENTPINARKSYTLSLSLLNLIVLVIEFQESASLSSSWRRLCHRSRHHQRHFIVDGVSGGVPQGPSLSPRVNKPAV